MAPTIELKTERRTITLPVEFRAKGEGDKANKISGYAARYYDASDPETQYQLWSDCFERIMPGAFASALSRPDDVRCLFNHDPNQILGRSTAGTCRMKADSKGLFFECDLPDSPPGHTVATAIERKDVTGCSFSFDVITANWREVDENGREVWYREITDVRLYDVGPVTFPAYGATECDMASARSSFDHHKKNRPVPSSVRSRRRRFRLS